MGHKFGALVKIVLGLYVCCSNSQCMQVISSDCMHWSSIYQEIQALDCRNPCFDWQKILCYFYDLRIWRSMDLEWQASTLSFTVVSNQLEQLFDLFRYLIDNKTQLLQNMICCPIPGWEHRKFFMESCSIFIPYPAHLPQSCYNTRGLVACYSGFTPINRLHVLGLHYLLYSTLEVWHYSQSYFATVMKPN